MQTQELPLRKGSIYSSELPPSSLVGSNQTDQRLMADPFMGSAPESLGNTTADRLQDGEAGGSDVASQRIQAVVHILAALLCLSTSIDLYKGTLFCWHPICMTLGFVGLMAEGIVLSVNFRHVDGSKRTAAIQRHAYVQGAALLFVAVGFWAIWQNKVNIGKSHFLTKHGKIGLAATVSAFAAALGGAVSFRKLGLLEHVPAALQSRIKLLHRLSGPAVLALAFVNTFIGLGLKAAGSRATLHMYQRVALVALGFAEAYLLWGPAVLRKLGWTRCGKSV